MPALLNQTPLERLKDRIESLADEQRGTPVERAIKEQTQALTASVMIFAREVSQAVRSCVAVETEEGEEYEFTVEAHRPGERYKVHCKRIK